MKKAKNIKMIPDMTDEQAEENEVVAAACCKWCIHTSMRNVFVGKCKCDRIGALTFLTDVCRNFEQK